MSLIGNAGTTTDPCSTHGSGLGPDLQKRQSPSSVTSETAAARDRRIHPRSLNLPVRSKSLRMQPEIRKNLTTSIYSSIQRYCERRDSSWSATPNVDRHERRGESMHALNILLLTERSSLERDREKAESLPITKSPVLARDCLSLEAHPPALLMCVYVCVFPSLCLHAGAALYGAWMGGHREVHHPRCRVRRRSSPAVVWERFERI